jgi:hypothetical protein
MRKLLAALMAMIFISIFVPDTIKAQDSTATNESSKSSFTRGILNFGADAHMGFKLGGGVYFPSLKYLMVTADLGTSQAADVDISFTPFKSALWFRCGIEAVYLFTFKWDIKSEIKDGINLSDFFSSRYSSLIARRVAISPHFDFQVPRWNIGIKINPLLITSWFWYKAGTWKQDSDGNWNQLHGWSTPRQYLSAGIYWKIPVNKRQ